MSFLLLTFLFLRVQAFSPHLEQVIIVSRHGVRGPYGPDGLKPTQEVMQQYTKSNFSFPTSGIEWGTSSDPTALVEPKLTTHGINVIKNMGTYMRKFLYADLLSTNLSCKKTLMSYADHNERDNVTAHAFFQGLAPECTNTTQGLLPSNNGSDLLFAQGQSPSADCPICTQQLYDGLLGTDSTQFVTRPLTKLIEKINDIIRCCQPSVCQAKLSVFETAPSISSCSFQNISSEWTGKFYSPYRDSLSESEYFSEWLLLQMLNNMSSVVPISEIVSLSELHMAEMNLITNNFMAMNFGSTLLGHIAASMEQRVANATVSLPRNVKGPYLLQSLDNRMVYYAGHDINLMFLSRLLKLQWFTKDWLPSQPSPGSMLIFELYKEEEEWYVKCFFMTASPTQIRNAAVLDSNNRPDRVPVSIPGCSKMINGDVWCPYKDFKQIVGRALELKCVSPSLKSFAASLLQDPKPPSMHSEPVLLVATFVTVLLVACIVLIYNHLRYKKELVTTASNYTRRISLNK